MDATETIVSMPIRNPETHRSSRTFRFMGVADRIEGRKLIDWKGVSDPARFIQQRKIGFQGELYAMALGEATQEIDEIEYRLITRPRIKYKRPCYRYAVMRAGRKTAVKVFDDRDEAEALAKAQGCTVAERATGNVSLGAYEKECIEWLTEKPERVVSFPYHLTPSKVEQARWYLWENSKRLLENRRCKRWLPNVGACFAYERECPYMPLCEAAQNGADWRWAIEDQYRALESSHPELEGKDNGDDVLTHSSLEDLARCEMYYYWRHEMKLRRGVESDSEPLWVGSAMHRGVAAYGDGGLPAATEAIDKWANDNPVLGEDANWKQDEQAAKARAMVQVAAIKWPPSSER
jgi:hypothetical protein